MWKWTMPWEYHSWSNAGSDSAPRRALWNLSSAPCFINFIKDLWCFLWFLQFLQFLQFLPGPDLTTRVDSFVSNSSGAFCKRCLFAMYPMDLTVYVFLCQCMSISVRAIPNWSKNRKYQRKAVRRRGWTIRVQKQDIPKSLFPPQDMQDIFPTKRKQPPQLSTDFAFTLMGNCATRCH